MHSYNYMDVMDYKNNYDTPRTEKRIEFLFSYPSISNEEKRKTNFTEALNQIENKFSDLRINKDPKINEKWNFSSSQIGVEWKLMTSPKIKI